MDIEVLMPEGPITELPPGYHEAERLVVTEGRRILILNLLAFVPLIVALVAMAAWWMFAVTLRGPQPGPEITWWVGTIILLLVLPIHELLHAAAIRWTGHHARIGAKLDKGVLYATADNALFRRNEFIIIALTPLIVITLVGMLLMVVLPDTLGYWAGLAVVFNAGGAIGDLWMVAVVPRYGTEALVKDEEDGIRIFTP